MLQCHKTLFNPATYIGTKTHSHDTYSHKRTKGKKTKHNQNKTTYYVHSIGHLPKLLLKILFQILAIYRKRVSLPIQILEMIRVMANLLKNKILSDP